MEDTTCNATALAAYQALNVPEQDLPEQDLPEQDLPEHGKRFTIGGRSQTSHILVQPPWQGHPARRPSSSPLLHHRCRAQSHMRGSSPSLQIFVLNFHRPGDVWQRACRGVQHCGRLCTCRRGRLLQPLDTSAWRRRQFCLQQASKEDRRLCQIYVGLGKHCCQSVELSLFSLRKRRPRSKT